MIALGGKRLLDINSRVAALSASRLLLQAAANDRFRIQGPQSRVHRLPTKVRPNPLRPSRHPVQLRRLRVSLFASIAAEPSSTAAPPIFGKHLKRQTFLNASRFR
jgi:hypothetical protein